MMKSAERRKHESNKSATASLANKPAGSTRAQLAGKKSSTADNMHDYIGSDPSDVMEGDFPPLPVTPSKPPAEKQRKMDGSETIILSELASLTSLINSRSDALEKMVSNNSIVIAEAKDAIKNNSRQIEDFKESLEFICADVKEMKTKVAQCEKRISDYQKTSYLQESRISQLETYSRRWNLRLFGLEEKENRDERKEVIKICQALLPEMKNELPSSIDVAHRLGPKKSNDTRPRGIIIRFALRFHRDAIWRSAKHSAFLRENKLKFVEDLSAEDRERRRKLWPAVEKARKENKKAFFVGGRAFVDGTEISP